MSVEHVPPERFAYEAGAGTLAVYRFGERVVNHYFCPQCGIYTFHDTTLEPGHFRINLGCVDEVDPLALPVTLIDGRSF